MTHCCADGYKNIMVFIMCILKVIRTCKEQYDFYLYSIILNENKIIFTVCYFSSVEMWVFDCSLVIVTAIQ